MQYRCVPEPVRSYGAQTMRIIEALGFCFNRDGKAFSSLIWGKNCCRTRCAIRTWVYDPDRAALAQVQPSFLTLIPKLAAQCLVSLADAVCPRAYGKLS